MAESLQGIRSVVATESSQPDLAPAVGIMWAVAVLGMIYGCLGVVSLPFGLMDLHEGSLTGKLEIGYLSSPMISPSLDVIWLYMSSALGTGLAAMLFFGSLLAINFKPSARPILLLWSIGSLIVGSAGSYYYLRWLLPPWRDEVSQVRGVVDSLVNFGAWGIGITLAIIMLILLTRPSVKQAFYSSYCPTSSA